MSPISLHTQSFSKITADLDSLHHCLSDEKKMGEENGRKVSNQRGGEYAWFLLDSHHSDEGGAQYSVTSLYRGSSFTGCVRHSMDGVMGGEMDGVIGGVMGEGGDVTSSSYPPFFLLLFSSSLFSLPFPLLYFYSCIVFAFSFYSYIRFAFS